MSDTDGTPLLAAVAAALASATRALHTALWIIQLEEMELPPDFEPEDNKAEDGNRLDNDEV